MTISDAGILELELEKVQSLLTKAEHSLQEDGVIPGSSEIESRINKLCKQLPALEPEDAKRLADQLPHLIKSLDKLAAIQKPPPTLLQNPNSMVDRVSNPFLDSTS